MSQLSEVAKINLQKLNSVLENDASRRFRVALYKSVTAILTDDDIKEAALAYLRTALSINQVVLERFPQNFSIHPDSYIHRPDYNDSFATILMLVGASSFHSIEFNTHALTLLPKYFGHMNAHRIQAQQSDSLWPDEKGLNAFSDLYLTLIALVAFGAKSSDTMKQLIQTFNPQAVSKMQHYFNFVCNVAAEKLSAEAQIYWDYCRIPAEQIAGLLAPYLRDHSGASHMWGTDQEVADYVCNLLTPYMREAPIVPHPVINSGLRLN